ncbi:hypothetical protein C8Q76DRAFT_242682 [Earliella scabrosa]|nr:hypothetical protein C8Q76DRAFT_242682 [Earliella scabrosa]
MILEMVQNKLENLVMGSLREAAGIPPNVNFKELRRVELQSQLTLAWQQPINEIVFMLQYGCDIVRTTRSGKLQEICFHFEELASLNLYVWNTNPAVSEKVASLEEVIISTPSKPKVTINIPSLKPRHAESIIETAQRLFPRVDQGGNLFMSPTPRESLGKKGHQHPIDTLTISMDGLWAVSRSRDYDLILWDVHQRTPVYHWEWRDHYAEPVISPDSQSIAGLSEKKYLLLYNLQSPASPLTELVLPRSSEVGYCPSNNQVFPGGAFVWSADGMQLVVYMSTVSHNQVLIFSRLPTWTLHRCISFERPRDKREIFRPELSLDNENQFLAACDSTKKEPYQIWDLKHATLHYQPFPSNWNEDSDGLIEIYRHYAIYMSYESNNSVTIEVFNMLAMRSLAILSFTCCEVHLRLIPRHVIWISPDQSRITVLLDNATVKTWDLATQTEIHFFQDSYAVEASITLLAHPHSLGWFSPDGRHVLLSYYGPVMRLLRTDDGACLATFALSGYPRFLQFSPDGVTLCYTIRHDESGCVYFEPIGHLLS